MERMRALVSGWAAPVDCRETAAAGEGEAGLAGAAGTGWAGLVTPGMGRGTNLG